ncbi:hypothetical protein [Streptomyces sp. CA-111067]|uniref:hypothetical protein n=1 Tax=Streptomyces sp. CA-111067 TaxID=3240046 RepID=UPI003D97A82B
MLSEQDVRAAVQRHLDGRPGAAEVGLAGPAALTWCPLLEGTTERLIETRTESRQTQDGAVDLAKHPVSKLPVYEVLDDYGLDAPVHPFAATTVKLLKQDSLNDRLCPCGNGRVTCSRCQGQGHVPCEVTMSCTGCRGLDPCVRCQGTGKRRKYATARPGGVRTTCRECGAEGAACAECQGKGRIGCTDCGGRGRRDCPDCKRTGTVVHPQCKGTGGSVTWTQGVIARRVHKARIRLPANGVPLAARLLARDAGRWQKITVSRDEKLPEDLADQFPDLPPRLNRRPGELARHTALRHLPLARITVPQQPNWVYYVFPGEHAPHVRALPSRQRTWQFGGAALAVLALVVLVLTLT